MVCILHSLKTAIFFELRYVHEVEFISGFFFHFFNITAVVPVKDQTYASIQFFGTYIFLSVSLQVSHWGYTIFHHCNIRDGNIEGKLLQGRVSLLYKRWHGSISLRINFCRKYAKYVISHTFVWLLSSVVYKNVWDTQK